MREWIGLLRAELLKVRRRKLGWLLLLALMAAFVFHARNLNTDRLDYQQAQESGFGRFGQWIMPDSAQAAEAELVRRMTFPGFLDEVWVITDFQVGLGWGLLAVLILGAIQSGEEYDGGTIRTLMVRGPSRTTWLLAKLAALFLATGVVWLVLALEGGVLGLWTHHLVTGTIDLSSIDGDRLLLHGARFLRSWSSTLPYLAFALAAGILARGAGPALALGMAARFVEIFSGIGGQFLVAFGMGMEGLGAKIYRLWAPLHVVSMEWNASVWRTWGKPYPIFGELPSPLHSSPWLAALVLAAWMALWFGLAVRTLHRRDITA
jgi:ABC-type transport system involved in multi-copper enzyme maturation permease subunit